MAKEIATKTKLDTRIAADIAAAMPVANQAAVVKTPVAAQDLAKKAIVIDTEEVQAAVEQAVEGSADVIVAQAAAGSAAAGGAAAGGMSTTALVVAGVAVAAAASSGSSSSTPATAAPTAAPTSAPTPAPTVAPKTLVFSSATDVLSGGAGDDKFIGDASEVTSSDQVDGGAGTDTVTIYSLAAATDVPTMTNVEILELVDAAAPGNALTVSSSLTTLKLVNATTTDNYTIGASTGVSLSKMADGEAITLTSTATDTTADITVTDMGTIAGAGVTVNANGASIATINLTSTGTVAAGTDSDITLASTGTEKTVNVSGSGDLALTTAATVTTIDASAFAGNITIADHTPTTATTIKSGSGNDDITAAAAVDYTITAGEGNDFVSTGNLTVTDSIDGGAGTDTLGLTEADIDTLDANTDATKAILAKVVGFEVLRSTDDLDGTALNISRFGVNTFEMAAATTADTAVSGFTSGGTIVKRDLTADTGNAAAKVTVTGATTAGTADTLNIVLNANITATETIGAVVAGTAEYAVGGLSVANFEAAGVETINVSAFDRVNSDAATTAAMGYVIDLEDNAAGSVSADLATLNITGDRSVFYVVEAATTGLKTVDGSASTGNLYINADAFAGTSGVVVKGGAGADKVIGTDLGDNIDGGAGADLIDGGSGADTMTGGAGADTFFFASEAGASAELPAAPSSTVFDTITDYEKGKDLIAAHDENAGTGEANVTLAVVTNATASQAVAALSAQGIATFHSADDTLAEMITAVEAGINAGGAAAAGQFAVFENGGSTYVFISDGTDNVDANDNLIKLTGITGVTSVTVTANGDIVLA